MNEDQARQAITKLASLFPDWATWAGGIQTPATKEAWKTSLQTQEFSDVDQVLCDWQLGKRKCPETFERERVVYMLVEAARQLRNNRYAKLESERVRENAVPTPEQIRDRQQSYQSLDSRQDGMGKAMRRITALIPKGKPRWEWTRQEEIAFVDNYNKVIAEYAKELKLPAPQPMEYIHEQRAAVAKRQQVEPQPAEEFFAWQGN